MKAKLDTSLWYQDHKLLKVREGASTEEIKITSQTMVMCLHPDKHQFSTWVQDNYVHYTDMQLEAMITQGGKVLLDYWHRWQQARENMIAQDQGICKQAPILPHTSYIHAYTIVHAYMYTYGFVSCTCAALDPSCNLVMCMFL